MPEYPKSKLTKMKYDSPSGFVNVGKYIPPFEKNKNGFGYLGVVLEDCDSGKLLCNICGNWYENFNSHLKTHNITSDEYKKKFGLSKSTALKSKRIRLIQSEVMIKLNKENPKCFKRSRGFEKNNSYAGNRKGKKKREETINKFGICDLQIADKVLKLKDKLKKTPTLIDLRNEYGNGFIFHIHKRYSSYVKYCKELGLTPNFSNHNPKYSREYFIEKAKSKEPTIRIFTINEQKAFYRYFKSIEELKQVIQN